MKDRNNLPLNLFGQNPERMTATRRRYELLFGLLLNSGLRISEALGLKVADVRLVDGTGAIVKSGVWLVWIRRRFSAVLPQTPQANRRPRCRPETGYPVPRPVTA